MHRFHLNRLWTLLLALFLSVAGASVLSNVAHSDTGNGGWSGDDGGGVYEPPPPTGSGDPDSPSNGGAGDASANQASVWSERVRLMVHALKAYYLRW